MTNSKVKLKAKLSGVGWLVVLTKLGLFVEFELTYADKLRDRYSHLGHWDLKDCQNIARSHEKYYDIKC